ncbi:MAG: AI-2E family transporter, partial [Gammaproteobacteria bacterium]|nr:AI-2E family transporter [Gammaproteobacteria bacterium]
AHIVEPIFLGRRLQLNPIVVLLSLWAGGWLWGVAGVIFAVPALVAARVAAAHGAQGNAALMFLSSGFASGSGAVTGKTKAPDTAIKNADGATSATSATSANGANGATDVTASASRR